MHALPSALFALSLVHVPACTPHAQPQQASKWHAEESVFFGPAAQLTSPEQFVRAGEAYFAPTWPDHANPGLIVFQGIERPAGDDAAPDPYYAMYVATLQADPLSGGLRSLTKVSPADSANTCGWFHPTRPSLLFGSTLVKPADEQPSGFQVGLRKYVWQFPEETRIVEGDLTTTDIATSIGPLRTLVDRPRYDAECSYDPTGRFILYTYVAEAGEASKPDGNIAIRDTKTGIDYPIVTAPGYDGGPFFSPDGRSICYRSDRNGDDLLQIFVADLAFQKDADGVDVPVGLAREYQLTDNGHVNWCPYWHPSGTYLIYASSEMGHFNYELFAVEARMEDLRAGIDPKTMRRVRVTHAPGADILPAFSPDGNYLLWTSQRAGKRQGEQRASSQLWIAPWRGINFGEVCSH